MRIPSSASRISLLALIASVAALPGPIEAHVALGYQGQRGNITGQVVLPSGLPASDRIKVTLTGYRVTDMTAYTDTRGRFFFAGITDGTYTLEVQADTKTYHTVTQEVRVIYGAHPGIIITLREKTEATNRLKTNVVSAAELDQQVPDAAKKEFEKGAQLSGQGKIKDAVERFKKAVSIFPNYLMARNNLGVQYLKLGQWTEAAEQFDAAIKIDSKAFNPRLNLAITLIEQKKYVQAIEHLNLAISIDSSSPAVHLYAGIASIGIDNIDQAERELSTAISLGGSQQSLAHFFLGIVYIKKGEREPAIRELKAYLEKTPDGDKAPRARQLLDRLKQ